ncbi:MAG: ZPR1 zinc finger domain-containing protein [Nanobdellota archaeon]
MGKDIEKKGEPVTMEGQNCPACGKKTLTLMEQEMEVPYYGKLFLFSMDCSNEECLYHQADVEAEKGQGPVKIEYEIDSEEDMNVRVIKSSSATIKLPRIMTIEPGPVSNGYITNIEGILNRVKTMLENSRDSSEDKSESKKCKNMIKKIQNIMWGHDNIKMTIEDPNGNSSIISEKAKITKKKK